jgi:glyoxylase I family protein
MIAAGVHHVSLNVADLEQSLTFYVDVLGLSIRDDRPELGVDGVWLDVGAQQIHLIVADPPSQTGQHVALRVDDLAAVVDELRGHDLRVSEPVTIGTGSQAFLRDPSGNLIELHQVGVSDRSERA